MKIIAGEREMLAQIYLKRGALVPMHAHESEQMTYIPQGALKCLVGGEELLVREGEVLHIPSGTCIRPRRSRIRSSSTCSARFARIGSRTGADGGCQPNDTSGATGGAAGNGTGGRTVLSFQRAGQADVVVRQQHSLMNGSANGSRMPHRASAGISKRWRLPACRYLRGSPLPSFLPARH